MTDDKKAKMFAVQHTDESRAAAAYLLNSAPRGAISRWARLGIYLGARIYGCKDSGVVAESLRAWVLIDRFKGE